MVAVVCSSEPAELLEVKGESAICAPTYSLAASAEFAPSPFVEATKSCPPLFIDITACAEKVSGVVELIVTVHCPAASVAVQVSLVTVTEGEKITVTGIPATGIEGLPCPTVTVKVCT